MDKERAQRLFQAGRDRGADFIELFEEETRHASVSYKDRRVESATAGTDYGIGIRLLFGTEILYAHTSKEDEEPTPLALGITCNGFRSRRFRSGLRWLGCRGGSDGLQGGLDLAGLLVAPMRLLLQRVQDDLVQAHVNVHL